MAKDEDVRITQGVVEALKLLGFKAPTEDTRTPDQRFQQSVAELRQPAAQLPTETIKDCKSPNTGAVFDMFVCNGVCTEIPNYRKPEGHDKHQAEGGLIPNGLQLEDPNGKPHPSYLQHCYEAFWQADIRFFVGKPVPPYMRTPSAKAA